MTIEQKQISTTVSTSVTQLWQPTLSITATNGYITVCPPDATLKVTSGSVKNEKTVELQCGGYLVKFDNSLTARSQHSNIDFYWHELYSFTQYGSNGKSGDSVIFKYEKKIGTFIASQPCYAAILVLPYKYKVKTYEFEPDTSLSFDKCSVSYGVAYAMIDPPSDFKYSFQAVPLIQSCDIPFSSGLKDVFEKYRIAIPTIITDEGQWHEPVDFEKDSYDKDNAYGENLKGPSKDNGWVRKEEPLEIGHISTGNKTTFTRYPIPTLKGGDNDKKPTKKLVMTLTEQPFEWGAGPDAGDVVKVKDTEEWKNGDGFALDRSKVYKEADDSKYFPKGIETKTGVNYVPVKPPKVTPPPT